MEYGKRIGEGEKRRNMVKVKEKEKREGIWERYRRRR